MFQHIIQELITKAITQQTEKIIERSLFPKTSSFYL